MPFSLGHLVAARVRDDDTQPRQLRLPGPFRLRSRERLPGEGEGAPTHREDQSVSLALLPTLQGEDCHERKALRPQRSCVPILLALLPLALAGCSVIDEIITMVEGVDGMVSEASEGVERTAHPGGGGSRQSEDRTVTFSGPTGTIAVGQTLELRVERGFEPRIAPLDMSFTVSRPA